MCQHTLDPFSGEWINTVNPCQGDCYCQESLDGSDTPCEPIPIPDSSSSSSGEVFYKLPVDEVRIRIPRFDDSNDWRLFPKTITGPWTIFNNPPFGWLITFLRITDGPSTPVVIPDTLPVDTVDPTEQGLLVSVILPEGLSTRQYWVPVMEEYRWARLRTSQWDVTFIKRPAP